MTVSCSTVLQQTLTNQQGNWASAILDAGTYTELTIDVNYTAMTTQTTITVSRIDAFGNATELWGALSDPQNIVPVSGDIGPSPAYAVSATFGAKIQVNILTSGTVSGTISIQGKG